MEGMKEAREGVAQTPVERGFQAAANACAKVLR